MTNVFLVFALYGAQLTIVSIAILIEGPERLQEARLPYLGLVLLSLANWCIAQGFRV